MAKITIPFQQGKCDKPYDVAAKLRHCPNPTPIPPMGLNTTKVTINT